jgi:hypothetical protein
MDSMRHIACAMCFTEKIYKIVGLGTEKNSTMGWSGSKIICREMTSDTRVKK